MPQVNNVSLPTASKSQVKSNSQSQNSMYFFSANPIYDSLIWGGIGAAAGAGFGGYKQHKLLKDQSKIDNAIKSITEEIKEYEKKNKSTKKLEYSLKCLRNKKFNFNSVKNWAIGLGLVTLIPQLICNILMWAGKKGYDKITKD